MEWATRISLQAYGPGSTRADLGQGARSQSEARDFYIQRIRRRLCLITGREMARHRLRRIPFIGVPRATVRARMQHRDAYGPAQPHQFGMQVEEFHRYQAHGAVLAVRA